MKTKQILIAAIALFNTHSVSNAMFLSKETNLQKLDQELHERALPFKDQICTLYVRDESGILKYSNSGAVIGIRENNSLCILTSAHAVFEDYDPSRPTIFEILLGFDSEIGKGIQLSKPFKCVHFYTPASVTGYGKFMEPDLAILICDPDDRAPLMKPFPYYIGEGHKKNDTIRSAFVGFGPCFDKCGNDVNPDKRRLRLGYTNVFHAPFQTKSPIFQSWMMAAPNWTEKRFWGDGYNPIVENPTVEPNMGLSIGKLNLKPHPKQAFITWGYSGAPLLFNTTRGYELAGIASQHFFAHSTGPDGLARPTLLMQGFEPVMPHISWIDSIINNNIDNTQTNIFNLIRMKEITS